MTRAAVCTFLVLLVACDTPQVEDLGPELNRARARTRSLEREAAKAPPPTDPERFVDLWGGGPTMSGPFLALPRLGTFKWRCSGRNRYFRIVYANSGATTTVGYDTPGPGRQVTLHSGGTVGATVHAGQTVSWTVTHRHSPGFIRAHVSVTPAVSKHGNCFLADVTVEESGRPYD